MHRLLVEDFPIRYLRPYEAEGPLARLKFSDETFHARRFARELLQELPSTLLADSRACRAPCRLLPVPLSRMRLVERGYNQSALIARHLCRHSRLKLDLSSALRKAGARQSTLQRKDRLLNLQDAFFAQAPPSHSPNVILLDDVVTTGATLLSLRATLEAAGHRVLSAIALFAVE